MIYSNDLITVDRQVVGPFEVNCYLVVENHTNQCWLIDPGAEANLLTDWITSKQLIPSALIATHGHGDHIGAFRLLKETFQCEIWCGEDEAEMLVNPFLNLSSQFGTPITTPPPDRTLKHLEKVYLGGVDFQVIHAPGHTQGEIMLYRDGLLFCGDVLFAGSVGRTDLPGGNSKQLWDSIKNYILPLPPTTVIFPGHGPTTTLAQELDFNPFLQNNGKLLLEW